MCVRLRRVFSWCDFIVGAIVLTVAQPIFATGSHAIAVLSAQQNPPAKAPADPPAFQQTYPIRTKALTQYVCNTWSTEKGLPSDVVISIIQTHDKYIWLGTNSGLLRFDGKSFRAFNSKNTPAITNNRILNLHQDKQHNLWVGTNGGGVVQYTNHSFRTYTTADGIADNIVWNVTADRHGTVWLCSPNGLSCLYNPSSAQDKRWTAPRFNAHAFGSFQPSLIFENQYGELYLGTKNNGLFLLQAEHDSTYTLIPCSLPTHRPVFAINDLEEDKETGTIWVATAEGMYTLQGTALKRWNPTNDSRLNGLVWEVEYSPVTKHIWMGGNFGLLRYSDSTLVTLNRIDNIRNPEVNGLLIDHQENIWCSTYRNGIFRLHDGVIRTMTEAEGLAGNVSYSIVQDSPTSVWVGGYGGLTHLTPKGTETFRIGNTPGTSLIRALCFTTQFGLLVGTYNQAVLKFDGKTFRPFLSAQDIGSNVVRAITQDSFGDVWIATGIGLTRIRADGTRKHYRQSVELLPHNVLAVSEDRKKNLYLCYDGNGVAVFDRKREVFVHDSAGQSTMPSAAVFFVYEDANGIVWAGTNAGLFFYHNSRWQAITEEQGLADNSIFHFIEDGKGYAWIGSGAGIMKIALSDLQGYVQGQKKTLPIITLGKAEGMISVACNTPAVSLRASDGTLWIPTHIGVAIVDIHRDIRTSRPMPYIEMMYADSVAYPPHNQTTVLLPAGSNNISIVFSGIDYIATDHLAFRYKLEGTDESWKYIGNRRVVYFDRLTAGEYRFVLSVTQDGVTWSDEAQYSFAIERFFYQTWWFYLLCGVGAWLLVWGIFRYRVRSIHRKNLKLESLITERTREIQERSAQLAEANHEIQHYAKVLEDQARNIEMTNTELYEKNARLEILNQEKNEFLGIVSHDLRNPLTAIQLRAESTKLRLHIPPLNIVKIDSGLSEIISQTEHMTHIITNLLDINKIESQGLVPGYQDIDIAHLVSGICAEYLDRAMQKQITLQCITEPSSLLVESDPLLVREILHNLISNALKYSPLDSTIVVMATLQSDTMVRIVVQDQGPGLTADDQQKIFGKFARLSAQPTGGEHSTGLGLSITKKMVEALKGTITFTTEIGKGTTFIVEMPLRVLRS